MGRENGGWTSQCRAQIYVLNCGLGHLYARAAAPEDGHGASYQGPHGRPLAVQEHREGDHDQGGGGYDGEDDTGGGYGQSPLIEGHAESGAR